MSKKSKFADHFNYSAIGFGISLLTMLTSTYLLYYFTDVLLLPLELISVLLLIVRIFDGAVDPAIGFYMDKRHTRFGKYRGYIIGGVLPVCVLHAVLFTPPHLSGLVLTAYCFVIYFLWAFSHSLIECAYLPLLITLNSNTNQRSASNTFKITASILASLIASYVPLTMVGKLGKGSEYRGFSITMAILAIIALITVLGGALGLKEGNITRDNTLSFRQTARVLAHDKRLIFLVVMYCAHQLGSGVRIQSIVFYMKYNLNRADLTAMVMMIGVLSSLLTQPLIVLFAKKVKTISLIQAGYVGACLSLAVIGVSGESLALFIVGNILYGISSAFPANLVFVYTADLADSLSGENSFGGIVTSLLGLSSRLGQSLSGFAISAVLYITGYVPNENQSPLALTGIWACMTILTISAFLVSVIMSGVSRLKAKEALCETLQKE